MNLLPFHTVEIPQEIEQEVNKFHPNNHLYGSRYMATYWGFEGGVNTTTDWDFAFPYEGSEYKEGTRAEKLGWVSKPTGKYRDYMHFQTWEKVIGGHKVQMCSKINLKLFLEVFRSLDPAFYWTYLHKSSPDCLPKPIQNAVFNQLYLMREH